ncbi:MAG: carbohydrate kinase family protein [Actinomycetales bacterium]
MSETASERASTEHTVLVVGEALVDIIDREGSSATQEHVGGSPANVALTLGRLGHHSHLLAHLGQDARGRRIAEHLAGSHVHLVEGSIDPQATTSTAAAHLDAAGTARYEFDLNWRLPDPLPSLPEGTSCLHTGSIATTLSPGGDQVEGLVRTHRDAVTISYDPNLRPAIMGSPEAVRDRVEALVALADVVKMSDEDAAWYEPGVDPEEIATRWQSRGPALVIVTRGGEGAVGFTGEGRVEIASKPISVVDTVGAGDTFSAGLIDGLAYAGLLGAANREALHGVSLGAAKAIMEHAARLAAVTVSRAGADTPWRHEVYPRQAQGARD